MSLEGCITRIETLSGQPRGTGFLIVPTLAVTCAHVVEACGVGPGDQVRLVFRARGAAAIEAKVLADGWHLDEDVAFLRLAGPLPEGVSPAVLGPSAGLDGRRFRTLGYSRVGDFQGVRASGEILGQITDKQGSMMLQLRSQEIAPGMSGAPVIDVDAGRVVGMVTLTYQADETLKFRDAAFAVPAEVLRGLRAGEVDVQESRAPLDSLDGRVAGPTATLHELPFGNLFHRDFERLCLALLLSEGLERSEHFGAAGSEQGRDIVIRRDGELWYVQCKRVKRCGAQVLLDEIAKIQGLMEIAPDLRPAGILFMVSCDVSAVARDRAGKRCSELGLQGMGGIGKSVLAAALDWMRRGVIGAMPCACRV